MRFHELKTFSFFLLLTFQLIVINNIVNAQSEVELVSQIGHTSGINAVIFSPDIKYIASASSDHTIKIWERISGKIIHTLTGHLKEVSCIAFSPNGQWLVSGSDDETIRLWNSKTGKHVATWRFGDLPIESLEFSQNGQTLFAVAGREVKLLDFPSGRIQRNFQTKNVITALAVSSNNMHLAVATWLSNQTVVWNLKTGQREITITHPHEVLGLKFTPDSQQLVSGGRDAKIRHWDLRTGNIIKILSGHKNDVLSLDLSTDGRIVASSSYHGSMKLWNLHSGNIIRSITNHDKQTESIVISPDRQYLLSGDSSGSIHLWNMNNGRLVTEYLSTMTPLTKLAVSNNDKWLATTTYGPVIQLWDTSLGKLNKRVLNKKESLSSVAFNHTNSWLAVGGRNKVVSILDVNSKKIYAKYPGPAGTITDIAIASNDEWLVAAGGGEARLWNTSTGKDIGTWKLTPRPIEKQLSLMKGAFGALGQALLNKKINLALSRDGYWLAAGSFDRSVELANTKTWKVTQPLGDRVGSEASALAFSSNGKILAIGGLHHLSLWHQTTARKTSLLKDRAFISALTFSPDNMKLASGGTDGVITMWNIAKGQQDLIIQGHSGSIEKIHFTQNGQLLISGSADGTIRIWKTINGKPLLTLSAFKDGSEWLVISPNGFFDGTRRAWQFVPFRFPSNPLKLYEPEQFFNQFYQPGLLADIFREGKPMREILQAQGDPRAKLDISKYRHSKIPTLSLTSKHNGTVSTRNITVTIKAKDNGSGLRDLRVFRNQSLVHYEHGKLKPDPITKTYSMHVPVKLLAGKNEISAYVFNHDNIKSKDASIIITGSTKLRRKGTAYVLAIGINQYNNSKYNLNYAVADANAINQSLVQTLKRVGRYANVVPIPLLNNHATKTNILTALARLSGNTKPLTAGAPSILNKIKPAQPEDAVIVFYAGHGKAKGDRYYLLPHYLKAISDQDLEKAFEKVDAGNIMLLIDACQSGQALETEEKRRGPMNSRGLAQLAYEKGMFILAAAQSDEAAKEFKKFGHGLLTYTLLEEGLKQARADLQPKDKQLTAREWLDYAVQRVPQLTVEAMAKFRDYRGRDIDFEAQTVTTQAPRAYYRRTGVEDKWIMSRQ